MKILFNLPGFTFGGTVFSTLNMISLLDKEKYEIFVYPLNPQGPVRKYYSSYNILDYDVALAAPRMEISLEKNLFKKVLIAFYKALYRLFIFLGIDYNHLQYKRVSKKLEQEYAFEYVCSSQEGDSTDFTSYFAKAKILAWFRSEYSIYKDIIPLQRQKWEQIMYPKFNNIVCVSKTTRDDFIKFFPNISKKVLAIHNIQNVEEIVRKSHEPITDSFDKAFTIVSVGRIAKQKQFCKIPSIAARIKEVVGPVFKWYIIGDGNQMGEFDRLEAELNKYNNRDIVICLGSRLNPYPYIMAANLLVNTSYYEACPRVVAESKILHTPVICADFSSAREFVEDGFDGYVTSVDELWRPIVEMISNKEKYAEIKNNCNRYKMDNDLIYSQLESLFN